MGWLSAAARQTFAENNRLGAIAIERKAYTRAHLTLPTWVLMPSVAVGSVSVAAFGSLGPMSGWAHLICPFPHGRHRLADELPVCL